MDNVSYVLVAQLSWTLCDPKNCSPPGSSVHGILQARILEWVANLFLQGIFLTQGLNSHLLPCRQILYCLSQQRSYGWRILEWVAISFSRGSSQPKDRTQVSCIAGRRFNLWITREAWIQASSSKLDICPRFRSLFRHSDLGFSGGTVGKESVCQCGRCKRQGFDPWVEKIPWSKK